jgi:biopolymer transport protein ExbD
VRLDMTPMIDVVFQLLAFFLMTLRIATQEGDLALHLPREGASPGPPARDGLALHVKLLADSTGELKGVELNGQRLDSIDDLHHRVRLLLGDERSSVSSSEAHLYCDSRLAYAHTIAAVTAVTGVRQSDGEILPLAARVRFSPLADQSLGSAEGKD